MDQFLADHAQSGEKFRGFLSNVQSIYLMQYTSCVLANSIIMDQLFSYDSAVQSYVFVRDHKFLHKIVLSSQNEDASNSTLVRTIMRRNVSLQIYARLAEA